MIFYEDRKGGDLLPRDLLPKVDSMRADVSAMRPDNDSTTSDHDPTEVWDMSSDDDDSRVAIPTGGTTSLPTNHRNTDLGESGDTIPEGVVPEGPESHVG